MKFLKDLKIFDIKEQEAIEFIMPENSNLFLITSELNLIQRIVKNFKTQLGSNYFNPTTGANLNSLFGQFNDLDADYIKSILSSYLKDYVESHKAEDEEFISNGGILNEKEQLENIFITKIEYDYDLNGWLIILTVVNKANQTFNVSI